jgi:CubicO group peptidase (beta-lactamase class C family)
MIERRKFIKKMGLSGLGLGAMIYWPGCKSPEVVEDEIVEGLYSPESQGVSSQGLLDFFNAVAESDLEFHSIMISRNGKTILEAWWEPFKKEYVHTLYSLSKSFTSTAIGLLHDDGKISVEDKVVSFFPDKLPATVSDNLAAMRVHDLLTMHTGHTEDTMGPIRAAGDGDWVKGFLALEVPKAPGTHFLYNTGATYMLSAIVQKVSGKKTLDFLEPRLMKPLGIEGADWQECPMGINVGGYGLRVRTQDILHFGELYLQKGQWKGKQLLSSEWVEEATKKQVNSQDNDSDWGQGYGYQFWRCTPPGVFRGDGAYGQYCIVAPQKQTVIAITSETKDMGASMQLVWDHILPAINYSGEPVETENIGTTEALSEEISTLVLPTDTKSVVNNLQQELNGKTYEFVDDKYGVQKVTFAFSRDHCDAVFSLGGQNIKVKSGLRGWMTSGTRKPGDALFSLPGRTPMPTRIAGHYHWEDKNILVMKLKYVENLHHDIFTFTFIEDQMRLTFDNSLSYRDEAGDPREMVVAVRSAG